MKLKAKFNTAQTALDQTSAQTTSSASGNENTNIQMITQNFDALRKMINDCEETLKRQVRAIEEKNKTSADNYLSILNRKKRELSGCNTQFETILSSNDHTLLLEAKKGLATYLDELSNELKALKSPTRTKYRLEGIEQLRSSLESILKTAHVVEQKPSKNFDHSSLIVTATMPRKYDLRRAS